jgi:H+/gluconate symporter-like permease
MDRFDERHPILLRLTVLMWVVFVIANIYSAFTATTLLGHAWRAVAAAVYAAVAVWVWRRNSPKTRN